MFHREQQKEILESPKEKLHTVTQKDVESGEYSGEEHKQILESSKEYFHTGTSQDVESGEYSEPGSVTASVPPGPVDKISRVSAWGRGGHSVGKCDLKWSMHTFKAFSYQMREILFLSFNINFISSGERQCLP